MTRIVLARLRRLLVGENGFNLVLSGLFLAALAIRLIWIFNVQNPADAIESDMRGYITRATDLATGEQVRHRNLACFPYGTHFLYAAEMVVFGKDNYSAMAFFQALFSALCVPFIMLAARRCFTSRIGPFIVGTITCLWYPQITFSGFFSSETPFVFFICLSLWLLIRFAQTGKGVVLVGLVTAIGFTVRPQLLMTVVLFLALLALRRKSLPWFRWRSRC